MISVICVYNDEVILRENLLRSLKSQNAKYELILIDNTKNVFSSLPKALNLGGSKAGGDYLMFIHQDVELIGRSWLKKVEGILASCNSLGVAGVAGVDWNGNSVGFIVDRGRLWGFPIKDPKPVMTLDEQLIIVPHKVFNTVKFDERFKWHAWVAEYCLSIQSLGLKAYVLPMSVSHNSPYLPILQVGRIEDDDLKLWKKHGRSHPIIYKTTGTINRKYFMRYQKSVGPVQSLIQHLNLTWNSVRVMYGRYRTMLDPVVPFEQPDTMKMKSSGSYSVGVSDKMQYLLASRKITVHDDYVLTSLENLPFRKHAFDLIIVRGILEYLPKRKGTEILRALEEHGCRLVIVAPNNGYPITQSHKCYRSIWCVNEFKGDYYEVHGLVPRVRFPRIRTVNRLIGLLSWYLPQFSGILIATKKNYAEEGR